MFKSLFTPVIYYAGPADPTGGGGGAAVVAEPSSAQPGSGQGAEGVPANGDFWGMFPNVPEEHRGLLEPHIKDMQGHVTRVEQQLSQFKPVLDSGYTPDQVQGLVKFSQEFDANPLQSWLKMGAALQQADESGQSVIHEDLDLEILGQIAMGQELPDEGAPNGQQPPPAAGQGIEGLPPEFQGMFQQMQTQLEATQSALEELQNARQQDQSRAQQQATERLLNQQLGTMKQTLTESGYPAELLADDPTTGANGTQLMRSALITANGNAQGAIKLLQDQRAGILKGFTQETSTSGKPAKLNPKETPPAPKRNRDPRDGWEKGRQGAAAFLKKQNVAASQG